MIYGYSLGISRTHTLREFCEAAFICVSLDYQDDVQRDIEFYHPAEVVYLVTDLSQPG